MEYVINSHPQGSPYGRDPYNTTLYGQEAFEPFETKIKAHAQIIGPMTRTIHSKYIIKARYNGSEATIEDIYTYATNRYMKLGCLDGPLFPHRTVNQA